MDLTTGFQIATPSIFVPWLLDNPGIEALLASVPHKKVTYGYYTLECEPFSGLRCMLGLHTRPNGKLTKLEFFRTSYADQKGSFEEFQRYFEAAFGPPTTKKDGSEGLPDYQWHLKSAVIVHYVFDRFGPEEHMEIHYR